ncbi:leucine-rich repeat and coiled-coil domain-containing protein 1-like [Argonauta hians]
MLFCPTKEVSLICRGLSESSTLPLNESTEIVNLHGNDFTAISAHLSKLLYLRELDLSSNRISSMEALGNLRMLRVLNLSCNFIRKVEGMALLTSLLILNVSHNQIEDISGFKEVNGTDYALSVVLLQDNKIDNPSHVATSLKNCSNLRCLTFMQDDLSNPICGQADYRQRVLSRLPQVLVLDNVSRSKEILRMGDIPVLAGQNFNSNSCLPDLAGSSSYEILNSQTGNFESKISKSSTDSQSLFDVRTPRIDLVMEKFKHKNWFDDGSSLATDTENNPKYSKNDEYINPLRVSSESIESMGSDSIAPEFQSSSCEEPVTKCNDKVSEMQSKVRDRVNKLVNPTKNNPKSAKKTIQSQNSRDKQPKQNIRSISKQAASSVNPKTVAVKSDKGENQAQSKDKEYRDGIEDTYKHLIEELAEERSRSWKAEQALKDLNLDVNNVRASLNDFKVKYERLFKENSYIKGCFEKEKSNKMELERKVINMEHVIEDLQCKLVAAKKNVESQKSLLSEVQSSAVERENQHLKILNEERKRFKKDNLMSAVAVKQSSELKISVNSLEKQVTELQQLLASRELEHKEDLRDRYKLGSKELDRVIEKEMKHVKQKYEDRMKLEADRTEMMEKHYRNVEKELKDALQQESGLVNQLELAYDFVMKENEVNKKALVDAQLKDQKKTETLSQLTNVVKKQKEQIAVLFKSENEMVSKHKQQMEDASRHIADAQKKAAQNDKLKQDCLTYQAQIEAQESLIVGLRAERKVWENELAQQGTSLAQDRGRLEVKLESMEIETECLKKQLKSEVDTVKIKAQMINDQAETIKSLKAELLQKDKSIKEVRDDAYKIQKNIEDELLHEQTARQESQFTIDKLEDRKRELKEQLSEVVKELENTRNAHHLLKEHWKGKSDLISRLEVQVREAKVIWENKEKSLVESCERAQNELKRNEEKMSELDSLFRKQLDNKETAHQKALAQLAKDKQIKLNNAHRKILDLEDEMRVILKERNDVQIKMSKLAVLFGDMAPDINR